MGLYISRPWPTIPNLYLPALACNLYLTALNPSLSLQSLASNLCLVVLASNLCLQGLASNLLFTSSGHDFTTATTATCTITTTTITTTITTNNQMYFKIGLYSERFCEFCRKTILESLFNKISDLKAFNLIKKRLWHRSLCVKFAKSLRTLFYRTPPVAAFETFILP